MGESADHIDLVNKIINYINRSHPGSLILSDSLACSAISSRTSIINGYIPDVMAFDGQMDGIFMGEAKTRNDLERKHTEEQIKTFLTYCNERNITLIVAVPWDMRRLAVALIKRWRGDISLPHDNTIVIDCTYE